MITSKAYKLSKKLNAEHKFGDVAVIVRTRYPDKVVESVAFLKAKKKEENLDNLSATKTE